MTAWLSPGEPGSSPIRVSALARAKGRADRACSRQEAPDLEQTAATLGHAVWTYRRAAAKRRLTR